MARCDRCGAIYFADYDTGRSAVESHGVDCPLCLLQRMPSDSEGVDDVESMARAALSFVTIGEIRRRIVDSVTDGSAAERTGELRTDELRAVLRAFDDEANSSDDEANSPDCEANPSDDEAKASDAPTNRELRDTVAVRAGVETTPSRSFRKEELVEVLLTLYRRDEDSRDG